MTSSPLPVRAAVLSALAAAIVSGCQWVDTRPEVAILPSGDLTASDFVDLQVDAPGARQARILVDGRPWGAPVPVGVPVHVDIQDLARGEHELVARVEQGGSPRSSAPRRLVRIVDRIDLSLPWTAETDPWKPVTVLFRSAVPLAETAVEVTDSGQAPVPFASQLAGDRLSVAVDLTRTLADLQVVSVRLRATGSGGERGDSTARVAMPDPITVSVVNRAEPHVDLLFTPRVPVPGARLVISAGVGMEMDMGEMGPSPWVVRLPDGALGSGSRTFEFRRSDARIQAVSYVISTLPGFLACTLDTTPPTLTPARCGRVTSPIPLGSLEERSATREGTATFLQVSATEWRVCATEKTWRSHAPFVQLSLYATSTTGFLFYPATYPQYCQFNLGWDWKDPGADPVTDGTAALRGTLLAVRAPAPDAVRLAYAEATGAGAIRVASQSTPGGAFVLGPALNGSPVLDPVAVLGDRSAVAWRLPSPGTVEAMLQEVVGAAWIAWPATGGPGESFEPPALAGDPSGYTAAAWGVRFPDGTTRAEVRTAAPTWAGLPSIAPNAAGNQIRSVTVAAPAPLGAGLVVAFVEEDLLARRQTPRLFAWNGTAWSPIRFDSSPDVFSPSSADPVRVSLAGTATSLHLFRTVPSGYPTVWEWKAEAAAMLRSVLQGNGSPGGLHVARAPSDGRAPLVAWTMPGANGSTEVWIGPPSGPGGTTTLLATVPTGGVTGLAVDPDGMSVAWTTADGAVHVRTLTP